MRLHQLCEDAPTDIAMRTFIAKVTARIMDQVYDGNVAWRLQRLLRDELITMRPADLGLDSALPSTLIAFAKRDPRKVGQVKYFSEPYGRFKRVIILYMIDEQVDLWDQEGSSVDDALTSVAGSIEARKVMMHELTHCFDDDRTNDRTGNGYASPIAARQANGEPPTSKQERDAKRKYFNCGPELNAYYHDIASSFSEINVDLEGAKSLRDGRDLLNDYGWTGDFKNDLVEIMGRAGVNQRDFLDFVKKGNRRKLLRRLYQLHTEIMRRVNALPG